MPGNFRHHLERSWMRRNAKISRFDNSKRICSSYTKAKMSEFNNLR